MGSRHLPPKMGKVLLAILLIGATANLKYDDLGQNQIRESWSSLQSTDIDLQTWRQKYGLIDVAEDYWNHSTQSAWGYSDVFSAHDRYLKLSRTTPFELGSWIPQLLNDWQQRLRRPMDSLHLWLDLLQFILAIGFCASILVGAFYLSVFAKPIAADFKWIAYSGLAFRFALFGSLIIAIVLKTLPTWALVMSPLVLIYSRSVIFGLLSFSLASLVFLFPSIRPKLERSIDRAAVMEALQSGRTRMEYNQEALESLPSVDKANWSYLNQDLAAARHWLNTAPDSRAKKNLELIVRASEDPLLSVAAAFEQLQRSADKDPVITFNLIQVLTRTQDLIAADRLRAEMNPAIYPKLLRYSEDSGLWLLPLSENSPGQTLRTSLAKEFKITRTSSSPSHWTFGLQLILIGSLLLFGLFRRRGAAGLCAFTGEATPHRDIRESSFYVSLKNRNSRPQRQKLESVTRGYQAQCRDWTEKWSWIMPDLGLMIEMHSLWRSFVWLVLILGLTVFGLSSTNANYFYHYLNLGVLESASPSGKLIWSIIGASLLYVLALKSSYQRLRT